MVWGNRTATLQRSVDGKTSREMGRSHGTVVPSFTQKPMKGMSVHLNTNGTNPEEGDELVMQELMRIIARVASDGRGEGWDPELGRPLVGQRDFIHGQRKAGTQMHVHVAVILLTGDRSFLPASTLPSQTGGYANSHL